METEFFDHESTLNEGQPRSPVLLRKADPQETLSGQLLQASLEELVAIVGEVERSRCELLLCVEPYSRKQVSLILRELESHVSLRSRSEEIRSGASPPPRNAPARPPSLPGLHRGRSSTRRSDPQLRKPGGGRRPR